jgi:hypothetical protein
MKRTVFALGVVALALALVGGAWAGKRYIITSSSQVKNGVLTGGDIKNHSLGLADLSKGAHSALKGARGSKGATGAQGPKGNTGAQGPKGDKGDTGAEGPAGPALPAEFSASSSFTESGGIDTIVPVTLTTGGVKFGPYPDGGTQGGSLRYDGFDGKTVNDLTHLQFTFSYTSDDHPTAAVPYMRVFTKDASNVAHDIILDPSQCARVKVPEGTSTTLAVENVSYLRYDDDACTPDHEFTWSQIQADHGTEGFAGGVNATAFVTGLEVNGSKFAFPGH